MLRESKQSIVPETSAEVEAGCAAAWLAATTTAVLVRMLPTGSLENLYFHCPPCQPKLTDCLVGNFTAKCFSWRLLLTPAQRNLHV